MGNEQFKPVTSLDNTELFVLEASDIHDGWFIQKFIHPFYLPCAANNFIRRARYNDEQCTFELFLVHDKNRHMCGWKLLDDVWPVSLGRYEQFSVKADAWRNDLMRKFTNTNTVI